MCTLTGHGLKDPDIAIAQARDDVVSVEATLDEVRRAYAFEWARPGPPVAPQTPQHRPA